MADIPALATKALDGIKLAPSQLAKATTAVTDVLKEQQLARARRTELAKTSALVRQFKPIQATIATAIGGLVAEPVRRKLVGRFTSDPLAQGVGLILVGGVANYIGYRNVPYLAPFGLGHIGLGGALIATRLYHSEEKPDPVYTAFKVTTEKYAADQKKKKD